MRNNPDKTVPNLFMAANWSDEKQMVRLFVEGLRSGVRGFDTAREYKVEKRVGKALKLALQETGIARKDVFIQTRISNEEIIRGNIHDEVHKSLDKMGLDYLDCFMFHWPTPNYYIKAWKDLEKLFSTDKVIGSLGICNCRLRHLLQMEKECSMLPDILQVEITPLWQVSELKDYCCEKGIVMQAFSPLCKMIEPIRNNEILQAMALKHGVSIPQIIIRWNYQRGVRPISLTSKVERVKSNYDIGGFELSEEEMKEIRSIDCGYKYHLESATCSGF